jgi:AGZA family xanthine/uracil permease-like MFS transporter
VFIAVLCFLGLFGLLSALLPLPAIVPILLYIGLLIGAQAFQSVPKVQAAAVAAAILPNLAAWGTGQVDNALAAAGTSAAEVGEGALTDAGLVYGGLKTFGEGAVLAGMVLGSVVAFLLQRRFGAAAVAAVVGAVLAWIGLIHAPEVAWAANQQVALGYALLAVVLGAFAAHLRGITPVPDDEGVTAEV